MGKEHAFMDLLLKKGVDVVQPDNRRAGGPTEWIQIAAIADGFGVKPWRRPGGHEHPVRDSECDLHGVGRKTKAGQRRSPGAGRAGNEQPGVG